MISYHNTTELEGKVAASILDMYRVDYRNLNLASIIAAFHRAYGHRDDGNSLSMEIINAIKDDSEDINERNLLVWNLYVISRELIDDNCIEDAMRLIERAEKNWSRDLIIGDKIGVYHISWIEQLWLRKAEACLVANNEIEFQELCDRILMSRFDLFKKAEESTGEVISQDRCTYSCLELMAFEERKRNVNKAASIMKRAVLYKGGKNLDMEFFSMVRERELKGLYSRAFNMYLKYYFKLLDTPYDNMRYSYCSSCRYYDGKSKCSKREIETGDYKACTYYGV